MISVNIKCDVYHDVPTVILIKYWKNKEKTQEIPPDMFFR
jgi:hypothetical protein